MNYDDFFALHLHSIQCDIYFIYNPISINPFAAFDFSSFAKRRENEKNAARTKRVGCLFDIQPLSTLSRLLSRFQSLYIFYNFLIMQKKKSNEEEKKNTNMKNLHIKTFHFSVCARFCCNNC